MTELLQRIFLKLLYPWQVPTKTFLMLEQLLRLCLQDEVRCTTGLLNWGSMDP